jgi:hypothetical protein
MQGMDFKKEPESSKPLKKFGIKNPAASSVVFEVAAVVPNGGPSLGRDTSHRAATNCNAASCGVFDIRFLRASRARTTK